MGKPCVLSGTWRRAVLWRGSRDFDGGKLREKGYVNGNKKETLVRKLGV